MKKLLLTSALIMGLAGCSTPQEPLLAISPKPTLASVPTAKNKALKLESRDLRTAQFVAIINNGGSDVQPIHANTNLREVLKTAISDQLLSQGYNLLSQSNGTMRVDLVDALVTVDHSTFSHTISTNVEIQVEVNTEDKKFTKRYTGKSTMEGGSSSEEEMELALNSLLEAVLRDMANDKQLNRFMRENI